MPPRPQLCRGDHPLCRGALRETGCFPICVFGAGELGAWLELPLHPSIHPSMHPSIPSHFLSPVCTCPMLGAQIYAGVGTDGPRALPRT